MSGTDLLAQRLRAAAEILAEHPDGLRGRDLWQQVCVRVPLAEDEKRPSRGRQSAGETQFVFHTSGLVKAGWLRKDRGCWYVTGVGRKALADHSSPKRFLAAKDAGYRYWDRNRDRFARAEQLVEAVPDGQWASVADIAEISGLDPDRLVAYLQGARPEGGDRVLDPDGSLPAAAHLNEREHRDWIERLRDDGLDVIVGHADRNRQLEREDLRQLAAEEGESREPAEPRAWLVRGSAVHGSNLVPIWLDQGYCSLSAARLRELPPDASRDRVRDAVDEDYQHASYSERNKKTTEIHAFLSRMADGDLVVTTGGPKAYLGEIIGPPVFTSSADNVANLQRPVRWRRGADEPLDFTDLPDEMSARLSAQHDVLDLTEFADDLRKFLGEEPAAPAPAAELPDATDGLARDLLVGRDWLQECVELLRDQRQLIFHGPPGTGKTYLALEIAAYLTGGGPENVSLVQFHPAYSYEDFFEGYRPARTAEGSGMFFDRRPGPFRRLVDAAGENRDRPYVLVIDEINRANLAKVFGELYFLLEYRDRAVELQYSEPDEKPFTMPPNVFVIATMNTADRSIALVDAAMRRRFAFVELHPDEPPARDLLRRWLDTRPEVPAEVRDRTVRLFTELNARIEDRDFRIGPSYLMRDRIYAGDVDTGLERVWRTKILPLLEEHHYGDGTDVSGRYGLAALRRAPGVAAGADVVGQAGADRADAGADAAEGSGEGAGGGEPASP